VNEVALSLQVIEELAQISTATVHEALGGIGDIDPAIAALWAECRLCGPAFTIECQPGDNLMIHYALAKAPRGDVLVVSTQGSSDRGSWGLITTRAAQTRGLAGLVIDGSVRDSAAIEQLGFPVFCRGRAVKGTLKEGIGRAGVPISVGGQMVNPGDILLGDRDGVVVVPKARLGQTLKAARRRDRKEAEMLEQIDRGVLTVDLLGLRAALERAGLL
jgi:4-hydroxy-4-methyl-2-oxoglutarate aldolase